MEHFGLIRTNRQQNKLSKGIRVKTEDFKMAFEKIKPGEPLPEITPHAYILKAQPIPQGASAQDVQTWMKSIQIPGRPIKALSSTCWLIGCADQNKECPPFAMWNEQTVLLRRIESKHRKTNNPILVGPRNGRTLQRQEQTPQDPWAKYLETKSSRPESTAPSSASARPVPGPTEEKFTQQQTQIDRLKEQIQGLETKVTDNAEKQKTQHEETQTKIKTLQQEMRSQFETMLQTLKRTIATSVREQETRQQSRFERIEELIKGEAPKPSPPRKVQKGGEDAAMHHG